MMLPFRSTPWKHQRQGTLHGSADPHQVVAMDTPATIAVPRRFSTQRSPTSMGGNRWNMWLHLLYIYISRLPAPGPASHHEIVNKSYQRTLPCFVPSWSKKDEFFASQFRPLEDRCNSLENGCQPYGAPALYQSSDRTGHGYQHHVALDELPKIMTYHLYRKTQRMILFMNRKSHDILVYFAYDMQRVVTYHHIEGLAWH